MNLKQITKQMQSVWQAWRSSDVKIPIKQAQSPTVEATDNSSISNMASNTQNPFARFTFDSRRDTLVVPKDKEWIGDEKELITKLRSEGKLIELKFIRTSAIVRA